LFSYLALLGQGFLTKFFQGIFKQSKLDKFIADDVKWKEADQKWKEADQKFKEADQKWKQKTDSNLGEMKKNFKQFNPVLEKSGRTFEILTASKLAIDRNDPAFSRGSANIKSLDDLILLAMPARGLVCEGFQLDDSQDFVREKRIEKLVRDVYDQIPEIRKWANTKQDSTMTPSVQSALYFLQEYDRNDDEDAI
jgi:hypothetical protein